jgi:hypothetical protein
MKIAKWAGILFGAVLLLIIAAGVAVMMIVDKPFIESMMEKNLRRQVRIGEVNAGFFSAVSGIEVRDVKISNFKSSDSIESLKGKPVSDNDIFASIGSLNIKLSIPPLLQRKVVLNELMLYNPVVNIVRYKSGAFNFSDLLVKKELTPEEKAELEKRMREKAARPRDAKPLSADDIPVAVSTGSIGMQDGKVNFHDLISGQKLQIYKVTAKVYDIIIDPADLEKSNNVSVKFFAGIKTVGRQESGSVESFDIGLDLNGRVIPFDKKTRLLNPEIFIKAGSPYGKATGLQIFNEMMNLEQFAKYSGKLDFLGKEMDWKNGYVKIHYKNNILTLEEGKITTKDYALTFGGKVNVVSLGLDLTSEMKFAEKNTAKVKAHTAKAADKLIVGKSREYVKADKVADMAVKPMLNEKGEIFLKYGIKGTASKPVVKLLQPKLESLNDIVKKVLKDAGGEALSQVKDAAKDKAAEKIEDKAKDVKSKLKKKLF